MAKPERLSTRVNNLIEQGVNVDNTRSQYFVSDLEKIKLSLIGEATKNAHDRAIEFAKSGGVSVGNMRSASQGIFQVRSPIADDGDSGSDLDTTSIDKIARVVVTVDYAMR